MLKQLLTSGVPAVPGPGAQFPLQARPRSLPFYLHNNTAPRFHIPLCRGWVPENHRHFMFHQVPCSFPVPCHLQDGLTVISYFLSRKSYFLSRKTLESSFQEVNLEFTLMHMAGQKASRKGFPFCFLWLCSVPFLKLDPAKFCHPAPPRLGN